MYNVHQKPMADSQSQQNLYCVYRTADDFKQNRKMFRVSNKKPDDSVKSIEFHWFSYVDKPTGPHDWFNSVDKRLKTNIMSKSNVDVVITCEESTLTEILLEQIQQK